MKRFNSIRRGFSAALFCCLLSTALLQEAAAQEFNCSVSINYQNLSGSDYTYLNDMQQQVREYFNQQVWTEDRYQDIERIECTIQVTFLEAVSLTSFSARLVIAMRRPIYNATQLSTVVQFSDEDWRFEYSQGTPLIFDPDRYHPLTSVFNFYAYLMLGYDYDTFSRLGGTVHFGKARRISELAQSSGGIGWTSLGGDRSRGELISEITDARFRALREAYFDFHFNGLDHFISDTDQARTAVLGVIESLHSLNKDLSRSYFLDLFFSVKYQEIGGIFEGSPLATQAFDMLTEIDPAHMSDYNKMVQ